jgi:hypothetical protein
MAKKKYHGSCHCGNIRFEATIDLANGTMRCNCSFCLKIRCWAVAVSPESFRLVAGEADLKEYRFGAKNERHFFCKHCGVRPYGLGNSSRLGKFYGVSVGCLDDAAVEELSTAPITYIDGRNDNWDVAPIEFRHL